MLGRGEVVSEDSGVGFSGISRTTQTFESKRETASLMSVLARNSLSVTMETNLSAFSASMIFADLWSPPKAPFCLPHTNKIGLLSRLCFCRALRIVSWNCPPQSLAIWIMSERAYRASPVSTKWKLMSCPILIRTQMSQEFPEPPRPPRSGRRRGKAGTAMASRALHVPKPTPNADV